MINREYCSVVYSPRANGIFNWSVVEIRDIQRAAYVEMLARCQELSLSTSSDFTIIRIRLVGLKIRKFKAIPFDF
jgi:hypothetical protein